MTSMDPAINKGYVCVCVCVCARAHVRACVGGCVGGRTDLSTSLQEIGWKYVL